MKGNRMETVRDELDARLAALRHAVAKPDALTAYTDALDALDEHFARCLQDRDTDLHLAIE